MLLIYGVNTFDRVDSETHSYIGFITWGIIGGIILICIFGIAVEFLSELFSFVWFLEFYWLVSFF